VRRRRRHCRHAQLHPALVAPLLRDDEHGREEGAHLLLAIHQLRRPPAQLARRRGRELELEDLGQHRRLHCPSACGTGGWPPSALLVTGTEPTSENMRSAMCSLIDPISLTLFVIESSTRPPDSFRIVAAISAIQIAAAIAPSPSSPSGRPAPRSSSASTLRLPRHERCVMRVRSRVCSSCRLRAARDMGRLFTFCAHRMPRSACAPLCAQSSSSTSRSSCPCTVPSRGRRARGRTCAGPLALVRRPSWLVRQSACTCSRR